MSTRLSADNTLSLASGRDHAHLFNAGSLSAGQVEIAADWILACFDAYYSESRAIPELAKWAFEQREPGTSLVLSKRRLSLYSCSIDILGARLKEVAPAVAGDGQIWQAVQGRFWSLTRERYEADLAFAFINSVRRRIFQNEWMPVDYSFRQPSELATDVFEEVYKAFDGEEDVPDWYFEDGVVFLPEEMEVGLRVPSREHRRMFKSIHGDLLSVEYWQGVQDALDAGQVPSIRIYPRDCDLRNEPVEHDV